MESVAQEGLKERELLDTIVGDLERTIEVRCVHDADL